VLGLAFALDEGLEALAQQIHCFADALVVGGGYTLLSLMLVGNEMV
jgi:hypothetical protein